MAPDDDTPWPDDAVEVARIVDAWGIKGWLKVQAFAADPQALFSSRKWFIKPPEASGLKLRPVPRGGYPRVLVIGQAKEHGDAVVAQAHGVASRSEAESLRGARVFVGRSSFPTAGEGEFYWIDLIGMTVVNRHDEALGTVIGLLDTGPHSVLRVLPIGAPAEAAGAPAEAAATETERLIPFVAAYIDDVSVERQRITVDWGLDY